MNHLNVSFFCLILFLCNFYCSNCCEDFLTKHLSSKTAYRFIANQNTDPISYPDCTPTKIWMVNRHGTRYPKEEVISDMRSKLPVIRNDILNNHEESHGNLEPYMLKQFEEWIPIGDDVKEKYLTKEGGDEMIRLGKRMKKRFPQLFTEEYDQSKFEFKFTPTERANESARHFALGLFDEDIANYEINYIQVDKNDSVLRFYKYCKYWKQYVKENITTYKELDLYIDGQVMRKTLKNISATLGYLHVIDYPTAKLMYLTCAFETAWTKNYTSPWCYAFRKSNFQTMEYAEDIKLYWVDGYGVPITRKLACNLLKDVLQHFSDPTAPINSLSFCHSGTLLKALIHLGLYESDPPLSHDNQDKNRAWKSSAIDTFATNLAFVLFDCEGVSKVLLLHQERPVRFPECEHDDLCPLETIKEFRKESLEQCDLNKMCDLPHDEL